MLILVQDSWRTRRRERHASNHETGARGFRWSSGSAGSTKYGTKGYLFWVIDVTKYYTSRHCVCTRVLDISIAWIEPVPGHIVDERVYWYGPGANTIHCVGCAPHAPTFRYRWRGWLPSRPGSKLGKPKNNSRLIRHQKKFVMNFSYMTITLFWHLLYQKKDIRV